MTTKPITTLLRLALVAVFACIVHVAAAQNQVPAPARSVITDGQAPAPVVSKSAAADVRTADGLAPTAQLDKRDQAALNAKPTLSIEDAAAPQMNEAAMNTWVRNFEQWAAATPNHVQLLTEKERAYLATGDLRTAYRQMYNDAHQEALRNRARTNVR